MNKRTCGVPECVNPHLAQDYCGVHYHQARKAGIIGVKPRHEIGDLDREARTGKCAICGPVEVFFSDIRPEPRCAVKTRADGKRKRARDKAPERWERLLKYHREYTRLWKYRLSRDGLDRLLKRANFQCEICRSPVSTESARIDHDHSCCPDSRKQTCGFCVRGILCQSCNTGIGLLQDDPVRLRAAAAYIDQRRGFPLADSA